VKIYDKQVVEQWEKTQVRRSEGRHVFISQRKNNSRSNSEGEKRHVMNINGSR